MVAPETALRLKAKISFAVTVVVVKSVTVELMTADPLERDTPLVLMEFELVGDVVPEEIFHVSTVAVPLSATMDHPVMVPLTGNTT